jgi:hypothetical protein
MQVLNFVLHAVTLPFHVLELTKAVAQFSPLLHCIKLTESESLTF